VRSPEIQQSSSRAVPSSIMFTVRINQDGNHGSGGGSGSGGIVVLFKNERPRRQRLIRRNRRLRQCSSQSRRGGRRGGATFTENLGGFVLLLACTMLLVMIVANTTTTVTTSFQYPTLTVQKQKKPSSSTILNMVPPSPSSREDEIRRKIRRLKKEGRINSSSSSSSSSGSNQQSPDSLSSSSTTDADDEYTDKVRKKLGKTKSQMLGFIGNSDNDDDDNGEKELDRIQAELDLVQTELDQLEEEEDSGVDSRSGDRGTTATTTTTSRLGSMSSSETTPTTSTMASSIEDILMDDTSYSYSSSSAIGREDQKQQQQRQLQIDPALFEEKETTSQREPELSEEELVELVATKLAEKRAKEDAAIEAASKARREAKQQQQQQLAANKTTAGEVVSSSVSTPPPMTTSGVGGTWVKNETVIESGGDMYKPKTGSWGAFPRPKDISKAYGGGRRVGAGFSKEDDAASEMNTKRLLQDYRRKVGIDVPSEKEHASEIEEALKIGQLAMQRGIYGTAVSALEKVTQWCSTNSPVGSKVYLELAMAYEAVGRTKEAYQVYKTLTECRMEDVKYDAKRLLYGMEAMEIMKDISSEFSRTKTRNTFIDATGLDTIAQNFDDVYNTAYIDMNSGFYKRLTESVVRSPREARQILLKATGKGEVGRTRIIQALRCLGRQFDDCLRNEIASAVDSEPTAYLNGKPIVKGAPSSPGLNDPTVVSLGDFALLSSEEMVENLSGKWRLQLLADKQGDGVTFFNTTISVQDINIEDMTFSASGPSGFVTVESSGRIDMEESKRILTRPNLEISSSGGGLLGVFRGSKDSGFLGAIYKKQQVISVDSILLITKSAPGSRKGRDADKEHFAVWRRISPDVGPSPKL